MRSKKNYILSAVLKKIRKPLVLTKLKFPELKKNQLLIKILYSGLCRSQIMEIDGKRGKDKWLPHLLGHEGVGEVMKIGDNVKKFRIKDKVIMTWIKCKGKSSENPEYFSYNNQKINSGKITTFSNYTVTSEDRLVKKPNSMALNIAPFFGCAIQTGGGIVLNQINPKKRDFVAIIGLGGVGLSALMTLKALNIKNVICIDINSSRLKIANKYGFRNLINLKKDNLLKKINKFSNNQGIDYCIESAGTSKTIELGMSLIKNNGKLIFASHPDYKNKICLNPHDLILGKKIIGSWGGKCNPDKDIIKIYNLFKKKKINFNFFKNKIYDFNKINKALKDFKTGKAIRPIIKMYH